MGGRCWSDEEYAETDATQATSNDREVVRSRRPDAECEKKFGQYVIREPGRTYFSTGETPEEAWANAREYLDHTPKPKPEPDATQVGGTHYCDLGIQPWDVLPHWLGREGFEAFLAGNVVKYLARYPAKGGLQDLEKARHYLDKLIAVMEADAEKG